jgi:hypothetical protein
MAGGNTLMSRFTDPGRRPLLHRRRPVTVAVGIVLITVGLVLRFALTAGFPDGRDVHAVGVVLIFAGVAGALLPGSARGGQRRWLRTRWISPGLTRPRGEEGAGGPDGTGPGGYDDRLAAADGVPGPGDNMPPDAPAGGTAWPR